MVGTCPSRNGGSVRKQLGVDEAVDYIRVPSLTHFLFFLFFFFVKGRIEAGGYCCSYRRQADFAGGNGYEGFRIWNTHYVSSDSFQSVLKI